MLTTLAVHALRVALLLGLALLAMPLLRRAAASTRHFVIAFALLGALFLPALGTLMPTFHVRTPEALSFVEGRPTMEPLADTANVAPTNVSSKAADATKSAPSPTHRRSFDWTSIALILWGLGAALVLSRLAVGLARSSRMARDSEEAPRGWNAAIDHAERVTGMRVQVRVTDQLDAPAVVDAFDPVILLPRGTESWSHTRRFAVLLHELAHVKEHDSFFQLAAEVACALHWFNPLVWMASARLRWERELAADDAVVRAGAVPSAYATDLLAIAGETLVSRANPRGALGMAERSALIARVTAIVEVARPRARLRGLRAVMVGALSSTVVLLVACATPSHSDSSDPTTASHPPTTTPPATSPGATSTLDPKLQAFADGELTQTLAQWHARSGSILVLDPKTGEVLVNVGRENGNPADIGYQKAFLTGSTLKVVTLSAALDEGVISPTDTFDCEHGARAYGNLVLRDAGSYGTLSLPEMLAVSTNIGFGKIFDRLGGAPLGKWLHKFHFGEAPIAGAEAGTFPPTIEDRSFQGAVVAIGESLRATPIQLAAAVAAIANDGVYVSPTLVKRSAAEISHETLMKPETAHLVVSMMGEAVNGERATGKAAQIQGTRVAGKTGTAEWTTPDGHEGSYASFVGLVPQDHPRFVILVGIEGPDDGASGGKVAAPVFARVATKALSGT